MYVVGVGILNFINLSDLYVIVFLNVNILFVDLFGFLFNKL